MAMWAVILGIKKLFKSPSEGARRFRLVLLVAITLFVFACIVEALGASAALITGVVLGAAVWITKGFKNH